MGGRPKVMEVSLFQMTCWLTGLPTGTAGEAFRKPGEPRPGHRHNPRKPDRESGREAQVPSPESDPPFDCPAGAAHGCSEHRAAMLRPSGRVCVRLRIAALAAPDLAFVPRLWILLVRRDGT